MAEVWFYHAQGQPLERALPALVEEELSRGGRVVIQIVDETRRQAIDDLLWTYAPAGFLPHGTEADADAAELPVVLTCGDANPNGAVLRLYIDGADIAAADTTDSERRILLFDGRDASQVVAARGQWSRLKAEGCALAYWQGDDAGRWSRRA